MTTFAGLPRSEPIDMGFCPSRLAHLVQTMDAAVERRAIPGVATVIARGGKVIHAQSHGYLDIERQTPLGLDAIYRMYSQTKPVTAALLMMLQEDGLLFLDDPISKFLPEFANRTVACHKPALGKARGELSTGVDAEPARREITVIDLLTMTSGLPSQSRTPMGLSHLVDRAWRGSGFMANDPRPINDPPGSYEDMVLALANAPLHAQPGETWQYGSDFDVLTLLIERATGESLLETMRKRVFEPLGMRDSAFYCSADRIDRLVTEHQWDERGQVIVRDRPDTTEKAGRSERRLISGNGMFGGMLSTAADYTRFAQMLLNRGELDGVRVLGRKTVELMTANHLGGREIDLVVGPGYGFGFGYAVRASMTRSALPGSIGTYGWGGAAGTWFFVDPTEDLIGLFFTHVFGYQFSPTADLFHRFEKLTYEALV
ncbi:MAG TPA: serine hydrolase domain-containing protein [Caulobacteraceae bacterium]|nr:serine hydrolase domain-containing protein [Caulobacteraceae bacterium]